MTTRSDIEILVHKHIGKSIFENLSNFGSFAFVLIKLDRKWTKTWHVTDKVKIMGQNIAKNGHFLNIFPGFCPLGQIQDNNKNWVDRILIKFYIF